MMVVGEWGSLSSNGRGDLWRGLRYLENGSCSTGYSAVALLVVVSFAEGLPSVTKVFCGKDLQVPKNVVPLHLQTGRNASRL